MRGEGGDTAVAEGGMKQGGRSRPPFEGDEPPRQKARAALPARQGYPEGGGSFGSGPLHLAGGQSGQSSPYSGLGGVASGFDAGRLPGGPNSGALGGGDRAAGGLGQQQLPEPSALHQLYMQQLLLAQKEQVSNGGAGGQVSNFMAPSTSRAPGRPDAPPANPAAAAAAAGRFPPNRFPAPMPGKGGFMEGASWGGLGQAGLRVIRGDEQQQGFDGPEFFGGGGAANPDGVSANLQGGWGMGGFSGLPMGSAGLDSSFMHAGMQGLPLADGSRGDERGRGMTMADWQMQMPAPGAYHARPQPFPPGRNFGPPNAHFGDFGGGGMLPFGGLAGPMGQPRKKPRAQMLNAQDAVEIYKHRPSQMPPGTMLGMHAASLAKRFNVAANTVRDIWGRRTWVKATQSMWTEEESRSYNESLESSKKQAPPSGNAQSGGAQNTPSP